MKPAFYVHASNIVNATSHRYGPFPGTPFLTYDHVRADVMNDSTGHIFSYSEDRPNETGWDHDEGPYVTFGWRRCYDTENTLGNEAGPYWTDLFFEITRFNIDPEWETNKLPAEQP